jgi:hypothetical protein
MEVSGEKPRTAGKVGKNSTIMFNTGNLNISGLDASEVSCYNLVEQNYTTTCEKIKKVEISGVKAGNQIGHNVLNFYNLANGAEIVIKDSEFNLSANSNIIRFDNLSEAKDVKIRFINCSWTYENSEYTEEGLEWMSMILLQPGKSEQQGKPTMGKDNGWEISLKDCSYNGEKIWKANETADQNTMENHVCICSIYDPGIAESFPYSEKQGFIPNINIV